MASFNQSPLGQVSIAERVGPILTHSTSSGAIIPSLLVTLYSWGGDITAGGATVGIGSGGGVASPAAVRGRLLGAVATVDGGTATGIFDLPDHIAARRQNA